MRRATVIGTDDLERIKRETPLQRLWSWLCDWPRPTWDCWHAGGEGRSVHFSRRAAQALADDDNAECRRAWGSDFDANDGACVQRGPWMRPSEVDALPDY